MGEFAGSVPAGASILDVGSADICGCYRDLFPNHDYVGLDVEDARNVDVVVADPYNWAELAGRQFDVVISGQCLEHVEFPWVTMRQIALHTKPGGRVCIIVPHKWPLHYHPLDCYRFNPDGLSALGKWAGLRVEEATLHEINGSEWDCVARYVKDAEAPEAVRPGGEAEADRLPSLE